MEVLASKILSLILMQLFTLGAGLVPIKLIGYLESFRNPATRSKAEYAISLLNCFAGGVFLGTTFLHLLPEVTEGMEGVLKSAEIETDFPVAEFIVSMGFFMIMLLEHLVMGLQHRRHGSAGGLLAESVESKQYGSMDSANSSGPSAGPSATGPKSPQSPTHKKHDCQKTLLVGIESREDNCVHIIQPTHHQSHHKDVGQVQGIRSLLLLLALSLHTVFEGLALGLQNTAQQVWTLFVAIAIHKVIMAFTMGIQFVSTFSNRCRVVLFMLIFSLMSPLGVGVGIAVTSIVEDDFAVEVSEAVLEGIATGTFVYVTFFEVLQKEVGQDHSLLKVLVVILGYALIALINLFVPGE